MHKQRLRSLGRTFIRGLCLASLLATTSTLASEPDWSGWDDVLDRFVSPGKLAGVELHVVDYLGLAKDPAFAAAVRQIETFDLSTLDGKTETIAFYINAYNILAVKMVVDNLPLDSIKDVGNLFKSVWKRRAGMIDGRDVSLDEIEHQQLRKLGEPRMHLAIVCASISCPDLRQEAYRGARLDAQLDDQTRRFLNNPGKGLRVAGERVEVSKIFKWFGEDFVADGGVEAFIRGHHDLPANATIKTTIDYDWSLNLR